MGELQRTHGVDTAQLQAVHFAARERRRSLAGIPKLHRTHRFLNTARTLTITGATNATPIVITAVGHGLVTGMTVTITGVGGNTAANGTWLVTVVTTDTFSLDTSVGNGAYTTGGEAVVTPAMPVPAVDPSVVFAGNELTPVTFKTAIRVTGATPAGNVFEFASTARGVALSILGRFIGFVAGGLTTEQSLALFDNGSNLPTGLELDLVAAVDPGTGRTRLWANGQEIARAAASGGDLGIGWGGVGLGSVATAANGTTHNAVASGAGTPTDFDVIEPLSVYMGQTPRQFT